MTFGVKKTRMVWLPCDEKKLKIRLFVLTEFTNVRDRQTDRRTPHEGIGCACMHRAAKMDQVTLMTPPLGTVYLLLANICHALYLYTKYDEVSIFTYSRDRRGSKGSPKVGPRSQVLGNARGLKRYH